MNTQLRREQRLSFATGAVVEAVGRAVGREIDWRATSESVRDERGHKWLPAGTIIGIHPQSGMLLALDEENGHLAVGLLAYDTYEGDDPVWLAVGGVVFLPHLPGGMTESAQRALAGSFRYRMELLR